MGKSHTGDSTLHSEDSGIGGENESLLGFDRHHSFHVKSNDRCLVINGNNNNNSWPDDLDVDNLPPPPPEVLLDNSFQSTESIPSNVEGLLGDLVQSPPMINQKTGVTQRLKASVHNVEVLPNRENLRHKLTSVLLAHPVKKDAVTSAQDEEQQPENDLDAAMENANCFYEQSCKIKHQHHLSLESAYHHIVPLSITDFQALLCVDL
ncbi:unnamed protein product [Pleuronectes platessa]|uniref:Uncharacterized protein n=1 Tax=Pleuronectes platessa TaxID=8262 RepID=A0A9N7UU87_PLEPL|nr:unnamed protein product [Pleuronectes platessa]